MERMSTLPVQFEVRRIFVYPVYGANSFYGVVNRVETMDNKYSFPTTRTVNAPLSYCSDKSCDLRLLIDYFKYTTIDKHSLGICL